MALKDLVKRFAQVEKEKFPDGPLKQFSYGTAGFRDRADLLDCVIFRSSLISSLRSICARATIGIVITASHNPEEDNGVKFVDTLGEMLIPEWEEIATKLGNVKQEKLEEMAISVIDHCDIETTDYKPSIVIARDTRPSGERLKQTLIDGMNLLGTKYIDFGYLTTPQLHYIVKCSNTREQYGVPTEEGYYIKISKAFSAIMPEISHDEVKPKLKLDGANGVGADRVKSLMNHIGDIVDIQVYNDGTTGKLNYMCGADFVKASQVAPNGLRFGPGDTCLSFDGDADRIVFFYFNEDQKQFKLLDGDKIACLMALFIKDSLQKIQVELDMSVIQTAYANGSSTRYLTDVLYIPVTCAKTGVKHLQRKAQEFDIGIFFEANGHGTVLYSDKTISVINDAIKNNKLDTAGKEAARVLLHFIDLTNQTTGDAIADMLLVQVILSRKKWTCTEWDALYRDLPNRQMKVKVSDRQLITTADAERQCVTPNGLQDSINELVSKVPHGRSFVRPSGTEDVVRVYAEAETQELADDLAIKVSRKVYELADGVGDLPNL